MAGMVGTGERSNVDRGGEGEITLEQCLWYARSMGRVQENRGCGFPLPRDKSGLPGGEKLFNGDVGDGRDGDHGDVGPWVYLCEGFESGAVGIKFFGQGVWRER